MNREDYQKVKKIFQAALDLAPDNRAHYLNEKCSDNTVIRREVEKLLNSFKSGYLEQPAIGKVAEAVVGGNLSVGQEIGHYKIVRKIGAGGMGEVFLAEDIKLDRHVAIKILPREFAEDAGRMSRFVREAKSASALNHPNIITIHEIGEADGTHFIATEYIEGETLSRRLKGQSLNLKSALEIAIQIASALDAAHRAGIIHRDIKPENVMIRPDGLVKILDFGIAKLSEPLVVGLNVDEKATAAIDTSPGMIIGTANYMSPEQARGEKVDARSDIFSFGIVLYEMLSGKRVFKDENAADIIDSILNKDFTPIHLLVAGIPPEIERIVGKTLRKDCDERYQTMRDLLIDLKDFQREYEFQKRLNKSPASSGLVTPTDKANLPSEAKTLILKATQTAEVVFKKYAIQPTAANAEFIVREFKKHKFAALAALGILAAALTATYFSFFRLKPLNSIAVLPFVSAGDSYADSEYLSDGLSEKLIDNFSQIGQLKVIARSSSFKYRGENIDIQDAASKLRVDAILTGRVVRRSDNLQISVELVNGTDSVRIWGDTFNCRIFEAQKIPEQITQIVLQKLKLKLSGAQERQIAKQITNNPQAYQSYLNGVFYRRKNGEENLRKAIEYQNQAIALDANFALAYVELSQDFSNLIVTGAISPPEGLPQARAAAEKSLTLDENLADAYFNFARIRQYEFEWAKAESAFKRAIELNPNLAGARTLYGDYLANVGRFDEALREIRLAQELDPLRTGLIGNESSILYRARRFDEALAKAQIDVPLAADNPFSHLNLAGIYAAKGQYSEAILAYQTSIKVEETTGALIYLGRAYVLAGKRSEAEAVLNKLKTTEKYVSPAQIAVLYAALGDKEKAFASLEKAFAESDFQLETLKVEPGYDPIRDDPRYKDLLRRMNLPE